MGMNLLFIPYQVMGRPFVVLTFEFVDLCYHSNETSLVEVLHSTVKAVNTDSEGVGGGGGVVLVGCPY